MTRTEVENTLIQEHGQDQLCKLPVVAEFEDLSPCAASVSSSLVPCNSAECEHRKLCNLLWESRPMWRPKDFVSAEKKLQRVGIETLDTLSAWLVPRERLTKKLQQIGEQPFSKPSLKEFTRRLKLRSADDSPNGRQHPPSEPRSKERFLWDMLWAARPLWSPVELAAADRKLTSIGINSIPALRKAAAGGINDKLRKVGAKSFTSDTVRALKKYVPDNQQVWSIFLSEARPLWTPQDVASAEQKLTKVGVASIFALSEALRPGVDLNRRLQDGGFKGFTSETIDALRQQLEITSMYRLSAPHD